MAIRALPAQSRIQLTHIGVALDPQLEKKAQQEARHNPRYHWIGQLSHGKTRQRLARCHLVCITSKMEGSSNVLSEALASGVPVVASKISGLVGTLGSRFPGYFPVGDTRKLKALLLKAESEPKFYRSLTRYCARLSVQVKPKRERDAWRRLLRDVCA
jgi:glycosyltransferase involved in cell wall biosynthesis